MSDRPPRPLCFFLVASLASAIAVTRLAADVVVLIGGGRIEGKVRKDEAAGTYVIETPLGTVVKPAADVLRVEKARLPEEEFERRLASVDAKDLKALAALVAWCREKHLEPQKKKVCRMVLAVDPNHEMARAELGYVVFENQWILEKELHKKQRELGLVKFRGEWMSPQEKSRRVLEEERGEIAALFKSVRSQNTIVLEYAVRKIMAYAGPNALEIFAPYLDDADENVRLVAVSALSRFPVKADPKTGKPDPRGVETSRKLFDLFLREPSNKVLETLRVCLRRFQPDETFRQALDALTRESDPNLVQRASELAEALLLKRRVPDLCRALTGSNSGTPQAREHRAVHDLLVRTLGVDHGFDVEAWLGWWQTHEWRYRDVP